MKKKRLRNEIKYLKKTMIRNDVYQVATRNVAADMARDLVNEKITAEYKRLLRINKLADY